MHRPVRFTVKLAVLVLLANSGCALCRPNNSELRPLPPPVPGRGIVLVADGAGDFRLTSEAVRRAVELEKLPLDVETFVWSHGYYRIFSDQLDVENHQRQGERLAALILERRRTAPDNPIYLVAHSAGSSVVLTAAESLPTGTIDRIILFGPAVSAYYDLGPALRGVRGGIDVFCSHSDGWYLWTAMFLTKLIHGGHGEAAGSVGFQPHSRTAEDIARYKKLCQYPWEPWLIWTGHDGGHFGYYQQGYLRAFVLPLLSGEKRN